MSACHSLPTPAVAVDVEVDRTVSETERVGGADDSGSLSGVAAVINCGESGSGGVMASASRFGVCGVSADSWPTACVSQS